MIAVRFCFLRPLVRRFFQQSGLALYFSLRLFWLESVLCIFNTHRLDLNDIYLYRNEDNFFAD